MIHCEAGRDELAAIGSGLETLASWSTNQLVSGSGSEEYLSLII